MQNNNIAQLEIPTVMGQQFEKLPDDLFIPPNALELCLETFSGPMDLLLYLIKKENINILDLDVSKVTDQYLVYIELMDSLKFELAADYLVMAATLAEIVVDGLRSGNDIGSWENLKNYQTRRRFDNFLMLAATDGINRLFSNNFLPIKAVRDFGLGTVNKFPGIKKAFIRYAMGEMPSAPRLMRGVRL